MSKEILDKSSEILNKNEVPDRATFFQLKSFVLGKEPTTHGQIWACVRHIDDKKTQIDALTLQIEDGEDDITLLDIETNKLRDSADKDVIQNIHLRKKERQLTSAVKNIEQLKRKKQYLFEELDYLIKAYDRLSNAIGGAKPMDDLEAQKEYWNEKLMEEVNLSLMLNKPLSNDLIQTILSLPDDMSAKKHVLQILENVQKQMLQRRDTLLSEKSEKRLS